MALEKLGPYQFESVLGRGGMGTVYTGRHKDSNELHAVKVLAPTYAHDDHFRGRFESEIKALLKLDHPNIVRLISFGQEDGNLFFSMELVPGNSLFAMQRDGHRFDWKEILKIAKDVSQGLRHAHDRGIIHRDLKPGNLLMAKDGTIKLTDFGIAKAYGTNQNTGENVLGTMDFMSPEQAKGEPVTVRSDLYSLGTVMFTLLSGKPPFTSNSIEESLRNLTRVPAPNIGSVVPNVPREIDRIIAKLMEKKPDKRYPTAQSLLHQLTDVEGTLKHYSEAQTAQHPKKSSTETFELNPPPEKASTDAFTFAENTDATKQFQTKSKSKKDPSKTIEFTDHDSGQKVNSGQQLDYFNEVSDRQRGIKAVEEDEQIGHGIWPIALALAAVLALTAIGFFYANKRPTADALFAEIESLEKQPHRALDEMKQFIEWYPEDDRFTEVEKLNSIGESIRYYNQLSNRLSVRSNITGENRLTEIEKQFVGIADLSKTNITSANAKMAAFVTVHENVPDLSVRDRECVEAAMAYRIKIRNTARSNALADLNSLRSAMSSAEGASEEKAKSVYESIIELYGDRENEFSDPEVKQIVESARERLTELNDATTD